MVGTTRGKLSVLNLKQELSCELIKKNLNFETLLKQYDNLNKEDSNLHRNITWEEECIISPNRTNFELLKRLMSMYSQKKPAIHQLMHQVFKKSKENLQTLPHLNGREANRATSPAQKAAFLIEFSPVKSRKFCPISHAKRKKILSEIITEKEIELIRSKIHYNYIKS